MGGLVDRVDNDDRATAQNLCATFRSILFEQYPTVAFAPIAEQVVERLAVDDVTEDDALGEDESRKRGSGQEKA